MKQAANAGTRMRLTAELWLVLVGGPIVLAAYVVVLTVARDLPPLRALAAGLANAAPTVGFGVLAFRLIARRVAGRPALIQATAHLGLAAAYALLTYWAQAVFLGLAYGTSILEFSVQPFPTRASAWQLLQNVTVYGLVATLAYLPARREPTPEAASGPAQAPASSEPPSRYFVRIGDEIRPLDVATIVSIAGADDYAEVVTTGGGRHLVRLTLAEFERTLDPARFIRVHRSRIVNVARIDRAEPAGGGRLLLHMESGERIAASREGSRRVRDRLI